MSPVEIDEGWLKLELLGGGPDMRRYFNIRLNDTKDIGFSALLRQGSPDSAEGFNATISVGSEPGDVSCDQANINLTEMRPEQLRMLSKAADLAADYIEADERAVEHLEGDSEVSR